MNLESLLTYWLISSKEPEKISNVIFPSLIIFSNNNPFNISETTGRDESLGETEATRPKYRGESNRIYVNQDYPAPWSLLPVVSKFTLNNETKDIKNLILELFNLKSKVYADEPGNKEFDFKKMISYSVKKNSLVYKVNIFLRTELIKLIKLRETNPKKMWTQYDLLLGNSWEFFLLNLVNWKRDWYKELTLVALMQIFQDYQGCITLVNELPGIREVWIEDGKKWRVLAIAKPGVRLFLSGFTKFLMQYFDKILDREIFHGFMHSRGINTYWKVIFEQNLLESENIIELDFSACFNNVRKAPLIESLVEKYGVPIKYVKLILMHINAEILQKELKDLPSEDGKIERILNKDFNLKERNLIQGLPLNPLLANLAIKNGLDDLQKELKFEKIKILAYADDLSLYLSNSELEKIGGENFVEVMNKSQSFLKHGLKIEKEKSRLVKKNGIWLHDLKLLGLKFFNSSQTLMSETRGRLENKLKKIKARESMSMELRFNKVGEAFYEGLTDFGKQQLIKYLPNYKEIQALTVNSIFENELLKKYFNTLISYLYKGSEKVEQNFSLGNNTKGSIMSKIVKRGSETQKQIRIDKVTIHVISFFILESFIEILEGNYFEENLILRSHSRIVKYKKTIKEGKKVLNKEYKEINLKGLFIKIKDIKNLFLINKKGIQGYETDIKINYGKLDLFYQKAKSLTPLEKELILKEIIKKNNDSTSG
jgi:hypothetical protein